MENNGNNSQWLAVKAGECNKWSFHKRLQQTKLCFFIVFSLILKEHAYYYISDLSILEVQKVERQVSKDKSNEL